MIYNFISISNNSINKFKKLYFKYKKGKKNKKIIIIN